MQNWVAVMNPADIVFVDGAVYTVDADRSRAQAVAVRADEIVAVGSDQEIREFTGSRTEVIILNGKMLLPAFQDAHIHAVGGGFERLRCDLSEGQGKDEYLKAIRHYAEAHRDIEWVLGGGWAMEAFPGGIPSKADLDAVVPDRPVFLPNRDHHGAWVNSVALERARIGRNTSDPPGGRIERDQAGDPTGTLQEAAMDLVGRLIPPPSENEVESALLLAQEHLHSLGLAGWQEAIVGAYAGVPDCFDAYRALRERGKLTARVVGALWWERSRGEEQIDELLPRRAASQDGFRATSVKIMLDGVCENFTASLIDPYCGTTGRLTGTRGTSYIDPRELNAYVTRLDREAFQVHFHAIGDRAVREALDAVEACRLANGPSDNRHHVAHIQVVHPADVPRFRSLGVMANVQPLWAQLDPQMTQLTIPFLGPERSAWQYPFGRLVRSGALMAFGSDWPVSSPNPIWGMHVALNRSAPPAERAFLPDEAIELPTAIAAYTIGSAYLNHSDQMTGSIEVGKRADLVILDRNLFVEEPDIWDTRVLLTMVDGRIVFRASDV